MVLLRAFCAAALLSLVSCWSPVFNQDLSVAELVRGKLKLEYDKQQTMNNGGDNSDLFQAGVSYDGSEYVILSSNHNQVTEQWPSGNNSTQLDVPLADPSQVSLQPDVSDVNWYVPTLVHQGGGAGDVRDVLDNGDTNGPSSSWNGNTADVIGFCTAEYSGWNVAAYYLIKSTGTVTLAKLGKANGDVTYTSNATLFTGVTYNGRTGWMAVNPAGVNGAVVYLTHAPNSSGEYVTDMVDPTGLLASWKGHDHVAGFLSTGRLLTREGSFYNVCDSNGKILYSFPAGTLQFAGEYVDLNTAAFRVHFTEALLQTAQNGGQDKVRVRAYSIATSKLDSLQ